MGHTVFRGSAGKVKVIESFTAKSRPKLQIAIPDCILFYLFTAYVRVYSFKVIIYM